MIIFNLLYGLFIIGIGFFIKRYPNTMSGYNTMSAEKRKNVDIEAITSIMKKGLIIIGVTTTLLSSSLFWLNLPILAVIALIAPILLGTLILTAITQKHDHNKKSKFKKYFPVILISAITIIVTSALLYGSQPTKVKVIDNAIEFTGQYGITVPFDQIEKVELIKNIPPIKMRTNGLGLGSVLKGHFLLEEFGKCRLFLKLPNPPFLYIETRNGEKIIFNSQESDYANQVYQELNKIINK